MKIVKFDNIELVVDDEYTFSTSEVAKGYGITQSVVRTHKSLHADELIENIHYKNKKDERNRNITRWTLDGVHMLGFFIKSERAKAFRKFTAKLLSEIKKGNVQVSTSTPPAGCPAERFDNRINGYKGQLAQRKREIEKLRWELMLAREQIFELEADRASRVLSEDLHRQLQEEKRKNYNLQHTVNNLAGAYARLREEFLGVTDSLEYLAKCMKSRIETVDHFIGVLESIQPKSKTIAAAAAERAETSKQWMETFVKGRIKMR